MQHSLMHCWHACSIETFNSEIIFVRYLPQHFKLCINMSYDQSKVLIMYCTSDIFCLNIQTMACCVYFLLYYCSDDSLMIEVCSSSTRNINSLVMLVIRFNNQTNIACLQCTDYIQSLQKTSFKQLYIIITK